MADKRVRLLTGSLRKPLFRYVQSVYMSRFPYNDDKGKHFFDRMLELCRKYEARRWVEEYSWKAQIFNTYEPEKTHTCEVKFIDGTSMTVKYGNHNFDLFVMELKMKNDKLEAKRNAQGHEDEPEDVDAAT